MLKFIVLLITILVVTLCININITEPNVMPNVIETPHDTNIISGENNDLVQNTITANVMDTTTFTSKEIPDNVYKRMLGNSIPVEYKDKVDLKTLKYLQITYWGFDGKTHVGEMVVNTKLANDVLSIFKELYEIKYPIEKIKLIDDYNANDEVSMSDNNTSCFCYRVVPGSTKLSNHAKRLCNRYKPII